MNAHLTEQEMERREGIWIASNQVRHFLREAHAALRAERDEVERQRAEAKRQFNIASKMHEHAEAALSRAEEAEQEVERLKAERDSLREALRKVAPYVVHPKECRKNIFNERWHIGAACTCGLRAALGESGDSK